MTNAVPEPYHGDMQIVARHLTATEVYLLCACLQAGGVPATVGDANLVQTYDWLAPAMGGANVRVPQDHVAQAQAVVAAFQRGELALDDDFDETA